MTGRKPLARADELVVEELGDELLIYDLKRDEAHSLSRTATRVWRACDGNTTAEALSGHLELDSDTVNRALAELEQCHLLEAPTAADGGYTRRAMTVKTAKLGAAVAAVPLIVSVVAPAAAQAVTEKFCSGISTAAGCGDCHKFGCCCCEPTGGVTKSCHADCTTSPDCNTPPSPNCNGSTDNCKLHGG